MSARRCPKCKTVYSDAARFCPKDGTMLVEVQTPPTPPPAAKSGGSGTGVRTPPVAVKAISLDRASTLSNQILDTRYQVLKKLGEGGMSYVYLAKELSSGQAGTSSKQMREQVVAARAIQRPPMLPSALPLSTACRQGRIPGLPTASISAGAS